MKYLWSYITIFFVNMLVAYGVFFFMPDCRSALVMEDSVVENLSALFYLCTFLVGIPLCIKSREYRKTILLVSFTGLLGFLDEISFGERILAIKMPKILGVKVDGAHDFFYMVAINIDRAPRLYAVGFVVIGIVTFGWSMAKFGPKLIRVILNTYERPTLIITALFFLQIMTALIIDLEVIRHDVLFILEEQFEMNAAIALTFCCLSLFDSGSNKLLQKES